jgi:hypothetical protein
VATHLLLNLQLIDNGRQLGENLVCLLMVLELCGDEIRKIAERFGGVKDLESQSANIGLDLESVTHVLHDADSLLRLPHKLILGLLDLCPCLFR